MKAFQILLLLLVFGLTSIAQKKEVKLNNNPIGVFDSGTGGLTVLEAMLTLDAFNNVTGKPGADGKLDFAGEYYQYLADQANMPYGNYAAEHKTDLLKEHILKNMKFFLQQKFVTKENESWISQKKMPVKMIILACNTATAYALPEVKKFSQSFSNANFPVVGVIEAGSKAALDYQKKQQGTIGVFATAGTVASNGYPLTLNAMAKSYGLNNLSIVSQGGVGLAESIDRDWSYYIDSAKTPRKGYKGPSYKNENYPIDTALLEMYHFNKSYNQLLCEFDDKGTCTDVQINEPANYVRYHLVSLLEKMRNNKTAPNAPPMNTLILGCTHYPYMKDTIQKVLVELYNYQKNGNYRYRNVLANKVQLIDPAVETAKAAYVVLHQQQLKNTLLSNKNTDLSSQFFIAIPNTSLAEASLQPDGWFTYQYKYGRVAGAEKQYVQYVPFDTKNVSLATYDRFKKVLPHIYKKLSGAVIGLK